MLAQIAAVSLLTATILVPGVVTAPPAAAAATSTIGLLKTGPGSVLAGTPVPYTLSASTPSAAGNAVQEYNVSFRDALPPGVSYKPGSTKPADVGDPTVVTTQVHFPTVGSPLVPQQTLIWANVADLPQDGSVVLNYLVVPDQGLYPVGSTVGNNAQDFASTNPRLVPKFTAAGAPVDSPSTAVGPTRSTTTTMSAITIAKSDDASPEGKLLRGAHQDDSVYTLLVTNNSDHPTIDNQVIDYLPANLEFLGCGATDNSAAPEYTGSGPLGVGRRPADNCQPAVSVETVTNPTSVLTGVFTKVTWTVPTLQPDDTYTIRYVAAIPLQDNAFVFPGGAPTPASGGQGSNLDNNTGASTRQAGAGQAVTNSATVTGTYTGPTPTDPTGAAGTPVSDDDTHTVIAKDVRVLKSVKTSGSTPSKQDTFTINDIATYSLQVDTSEYTSAQDIVLTDHLDNGVCPLVTTDQWATLVAANPSLGSVTGCVDDQRGPAIDTGPAISYTNVTFDPATGTFTMTFSPIANLAAQSSLHITYPARMLANYPGGPLVGTQTSAGDSFANTVSLTATTTPVAGTPENGPSQITDTSSAELVSGAPAIKKLIKPLPVIPATDYSCAGSGYADPTNPALPATRTTFALGDLVCFELRATFATGTFTRNAAVTDFLPQGTTFVAASIGPDNTVPTDQIVLDTSAAGNGTLNWALGHTSGNARLLDPGETFVARVAVRITNPANPGAVDIAGNLMKLRQQNSAGKVISLRDQVNFAIAPAIPLSLTKGVASINGAPNPQNPAKTDHQPVKQGDVVDFRVDISHLGTAATSTDRPVSDINVWDVLPALFSCADLTASAVFGQECRDPDALGNWHPLTTGRSIIRWTIPDALAAGGTARLDYTLTVPQVGPAIDVTNTASISQYTADSDDQPGGEIYYPAGNIDADIPAASQLAPAVADSSDVYTSAAAATKTITSAITEPGNDGAEQAAVGELQTFTIGALVPAGLTVNSATLADALPANGLELLNATHPPTAALAPDASAPGVRTGLPTGFSLDLGSGVLRFPASYTNTTGTDQLVLLTLTGRFTAAVGRQGDTRVDDATFTYTPVGGPPTVLTQPGTSTVVEPLPTLNKSVSPTGPYTAGQTITYQLTAGNTAGRPTAYDNWVLDCVPAGLVVTGYVSGGPALGTADTPAPGTGTGSGGNGCATGTTRIGWHVGDLAGGVSASLFYTATIQATAAAGQTYLNTANLSASSIPGVRDTPGSPLPEGARGYTATDHQTVTITTPALTKTATPDHANIGTTITFTVTAQIPAQINLYHAVLRDLLPAGLDGATLSTVSLTCTQNPGGCPLPASAPTTTPSGSGTLATWDLGDLLAQPQIRTITLTYTAVLADIPSITRGAPVTNGASIAWNATTGGGVPPFNPAGISTSATVIVTEPVIHLAKTVSNTTPEPGQVFDYTLKAANGGGATDSNAGPAYSVVISDAVPAGVIIDPTTLPAGTTITGQNPNGSGGTLTWSIPGPLLVGGSATITYHATLAPSAGLGAAGQRNTATVTDFYSQPNSGGRHSTPGTTASRTVTPDFPKIVPSKAAVTTGPAYAGTPFTWQLTLTNAGTGRAYNLAATDILPPHWTYDTGSAKVTTAGGAAVALEPAITAATATNGPTLTWTALASLHGNPATDGLAPGQTVLITLDATPGPDAPTATGTASPDTNTLTATGTDATNAPGSAAGPYGTGTGTAVALIAAADVQLSKTAGTFTAGGQGSWTLTVKNNGPDTAAGPFNLTDTVPATLTLPGGAAGAALTLVSATGPGWSCTIDATTAAVACSRVNGSEVLPAGESFPPVTITVGIPPDAIAGSTASNSGAITDRTYDPDTSNNTDSATGTVLTEGDLQITKTVNGALTAGANASYTIGVTNLGPSVSLADAATPITVTDTLPAGTVFVSAAGTGWTCPTPMAGALTCQWSTTLPAPSSATALTVTVRVPADRSSAVVNTAAVTPGSTPDHDVLGGDNTATVTSTPELQADLGISKLLVNKDTQPIVAGTDRSYDLAITNYGPSDATGVSITDTLPAFVSSNSTFASISGTWTCVTSGQRVTCTLAGALAGPNLGTPVTDTVRISVHIADNFDTATSIVNSASVTADTTDPGPTANTTSDDSSVTGQADLTLDKTITTAAVAGRTMTYRLQVHNLGPSVATGPSTVVDTLPAGLTFDAANLPSGPGWTCTLTNPSTVSCSYPAAVGTDGSGHNLAAPITAPVKVDEQSVGTVVNRATVSGPLFDPVPENDTVTRDTPITQLADVSITKTASKPTALAGTDLTYGIAVLNAGPSTARVLSVTDTPDPGLVVTALSGPGWTCTLATLTCLRDELTVAAGTSTITGTAHPASSVPTGTRLTNAADLTVATPHSPGTPAWHSQATITVATLAGVSLTKTHDPAGDPVAAGDAVNFTLTASNAGPSDAVGPISIIDTLPAGMSYLSSQGPWTCTTAGQVVTCTLNPASATIAADGQAPTLQLSVAIDSAVLGATLTNNAAAATGTPQDPTIPVTATDAVPVTTTADLSVVKSHTGTATAGQHFTWTVTVTNLGPSVSRAGAHTPITVTDTLPPGTTFVSGGSTPSGFSCQAATTANTVICTRTADLAVDDPATAPTTAFPITVAIAPSVRAGLTNNASITPGITTEPPGPVAAANNTTSDPVDVLTQADLTITKTHPDSARAVAGSPFTWTITVTDAGPSDSYASNGSPITVTDTLPAGVTFSAATSDDFTCAAGTVNGNVACQATAPLTVGPHQISLTALVDPATLGDADPADPTVHTLSNTAAITTSTTPDLAGPNTATDIAPLNTRADLAIVKSHPAGATAIPGQQFSWTLQVSNLGPSVSRASIAHPITVTDTLPAGITLISATGQGWQCAAVDQLLTCTAGTTDTPADLPVGSAAPITVTTAVQVQATGSLTNAASIHPGTTTDADAADPAGNNTSTDTAVPVGPQADLSIHKTHDAANVRVGDPITFTLTVANNGPSTAAIVVVDDTMPTGLTPLAASAPGWTCGIQGQQVTCTLDSAGGLAPLTTPGGTEQQLSITAAVTGGAYPGVTNTAAVTSATPDPSTINNTAADPVKVPALEDLSITKTLLGPLVVGQQGIYRLTVTNHGPTEAPGPITVTDTLPTGLTGVSAKGTSIKGAQAPGIAAQTSCSIAATIICRLPAALSAGDTAVIDVTVQVTSAAYPSITNTAAVNSTATDINPSNNQATLTSPVTPLAGLGLTKTLIGTGPDRDGLLSWRLSITNTGPNPSTAPLTVIDQLPIGLGYHDFSGSNGWWCRADGRTVTCAFSGTITVHAFTAVIIRTTVRATPGTALVNRATLRGPTGPIIAVADAGYSVPTAPPITTPPTAPPTTPPTTAPTSPPPSTSPPATTPPAPPNQLPNTGINLSPMLITAALLLLAGAAITLGGRRRRGRSR